MCCCRRTSSWSSFWIRVCSLWAPLILSAPVPALLSQHHATSRLPLYGTTSIPTKTSYRYQADMSLMCFFVTGMCPFWSGCWPSCWAYAFRTLTTSWLCGCVPSWRVLCVPVAVCLYGTRRFFSAASSLWPSSWRVWWTTAERWPVSLANLCVSCRKQRSSHEDSHCKFHNTHTQTLPLYVCSCLQSL